MKSETARAALVKAEEEWARGWMEKHLGLVMLYYADDAVMLSSVRPPVEGRKAIGDFMSRLFQLPGLITRIMPARAEVSEGGDMGFTQGRYESTIPDAAGKSATHAGTYLAVWKTHFDGSWRMVAYSSNANPK
jgi:ketosteroid isomerase-like protein